MPTARATRGLRWAWDERAATGLEAALSDESWRVREMAVKVVRRHHLLRDYLPLVDRRRDDPVARVRSVALDTFERLASRGL
ncbi:MAG: HEAT repeat domain-containing protein [Candidatus Dormibacteraceae bacterium]